MLQRVTLLLVTVLLLSVATPAAAAGAGASQSECTYPMTLTDATGTDVSIDEEPERVVAVMPSDAQTVIEIGAEDRLVGMPLGPSTAHLDATDQEDITESDGYTVDTEAVVALEPDVVVVANAASDELVEQLRGLDLTVYQHPTAESIEDVRTNVRTTGQLTGECQGAETTVQWMDDRLELLESAVEDTEPALAYYEMGDGFTAGAGTFQHELMETAGLQNLAAEAGIDGWNIISEEVVVDMDPEWFLYGDSWGSSPIPSSMDDTTAATAGNEVVVTSNYFSQPGPHVVYAVEEIVETVYPEAYDEITPDLEAIDEERSEEANGTSNASDEDDDESGTDSIPAFGVPAAVAALLSIIAVGRRAA